MHSHTLQQGNILDSKVQKFGIRRARIVQDKLIDAEGFTFLFEVNNIRLFTGGGLYTSAIDGRIYVPSQALTGYPRIHS